MKTKEKSKIVEIHLRFIRKDFERMQKIKNKSGLTWEDFIVDITNFK